MPPSRGLRPAGQLLGRIARPLVAPRTGVRTLSSAPFAAKYSIRPQILTASASIPVTSYILQSGKANLSLWPFSGKEISIPPPNDAPKPTAGDSSVTEVLPSSSPSEAVSAAAEKASETASAVAAEAHHISDSVSHAIEGSTASEMASQLSPAFLENITYIGQMKDLGLSYGFPYITASVQSVVEHIHVYAGTPWWGTIVLSAIAMRVLMLYPFFKMSVSQAKMSHLQPKLKPFIEDMARARQEGDRMAMQIAQTQMSRLRRRAGLSMGWMFAPVVVQAAFGYGAFKLTRAMAALPVPGFETGGFAWITDLTVADPYYVLPVAMFAFTHLLSRTSIRDAAATQDLATQAWSKPLMLYILPVIMSLVTAWQPAALQLSFLTAILFGANQNLLFRNNTFRDLFGMERFARPRGPGDVEYGMGGGRTVDVTPQARETQVAKEAWSESPFANLNVARKQTSSIESQKGVRYQAPTAASTLRVAEHNIEATKAKMQELGPEVPKQDSFATREIREMREGFGNLIQKGKETFAQRQEKELGGLKGRPKEYVRKARAFEERKREREGRGR